MVPADDWGNDAYCAVWESRRLPGNAAQSVLNAAMDRHTRETAMSARVESADLAFWHDSIDGVSTVNMRFHDASTYQRWRMFMLSDPAGAFQINFVCGARLPTTQEQESEIDAIVSSLRFYPEHQ